MSGAARLRRVQAALAAGHRPAPDDLAYFLSIDPASVSSSPGEAEAARREMRDLVVEFARRFRLTAESVHREISFYEGTSWPRERAQDECPPRLLGRRQEFCWRILRIHGRGGPSEKTIRRILERRSFGQVKGGLSKSSR